MSRLKIRERTLETVIFSLWRKLMLPDSQSRIRQDVLTDGELKEFEERRDELYPSINKTDVRDADSSKCFNQFEWQFDSNGETNLNFLASYRDVSHDRLILDMSVEIGHLSEADYRRHIRQIENDAVVRNSIPLQFIDGSLYRGSDLVKRLQTRNPPTRLQVVLQMFQDQNWPTSVEVPHNWNGSKVKGVCSQLRKRFAGEFHFGEGEGGTSIRMRDIRTTLKVAPK